MNKTPNAETIAAMEEARRLGRPFYDYVSTYCDRIQNGRTLMNIYEAGKSEMAELDVEMTTDTPGEDGIVGEAMDVILCMMDLIRNAAPDMDNAEFLALAEKKLEKWQKHYANSIHRVR